MGVACRGPSLRPKGESGSRWAPRGVVGEARHRRSGRRRGRGRREASRCGRAGGEPRGAVRRPAGYIPWSHGPFVVTDCPEGRRGATSWQDGTSWQARKALVSRRHLPPAKTSNVRAHIGEKGRGDIRRHQLPAPDSSRAGQAEAEEVAGRAGDDRVRPGLDRHAPFRCLPAVLASGFAATSSRRKCQARSPTGCICNVACGDSCSRSELRGPARPRSRFRADRAGSNQLPRDWQRSDNFVLPILGEGPAVPSSRPQ